eukprot:6191304-Pleurochrysis_carterae.AAC.3
MRFCRLSELLVCSSSPFEIEYVRSLRKVDLANVAVVRPIGFGANAGAAAGHDDDHHSHDNDDDDHDDDDGSADGGLADEYLDPAPAGLDKTTRFYVMPMVNEVQLNLAEQLTQRGVPVWTPPSASVDGGWGGPDVRCSFKHKPEHSCQTTLSHP